MEVVDVGLVLDGLIAMFIGGPVTEAALYASACHPRSEALVVVVASVVALSVRCTTKLTGPHDQSVLQHVALLEVGEQSRDRLIRSHPSCCRAVLVRGCNADPSCRE